MATARRLKVEDMTIFRIPIATYRVQLNKHFPFADVQALVAYLHRLGITELYTSPFLKARPGSPHGYIQFLIQRLVMMKTWRLSVQS